MEFDELPAQGQPDLTERARGQVVFELPHPRADGATHLLLDPLELIEKLTLLIQIGRASCRERV